jgi:hypothetical protein
VAIWYIFPRFGIFCQEESGNPVTDQANAIDAHKPIDIGRFLLKTHFPM